MRVLRALLVIITVMILCIACNKEFPNARSLGQHLRFCKKKDSFCTASLKRRREDDEKLKVGKLMQLEKQKDVEQAKQALRESLNEVCSHQFP